MTDLGAVLGLRWPFADLALVLEPTTVILAPITLSALFWIDSELSKKFTAFLSVPFDVPVDRWDTDRQLTLFSQNA